MLKAPNGQPWSQYIRVKRVEAAPSPLQPIEQLNKHEPIPEIDLIVRSRPATSHQKTRQPRPQSRAQTTTGSNRRRRKPSKNPCNIKKPVSPTKTKAEKAHLFSQWLKNKEIEERLKSKKKKKERKRDRQRQQEKENLKEKKWAQLCETKQKQSATTTAVLNTKLTFIHPVKQQEQRNELLLKQLKQAKMQEWFAKKDLEKAQRERKMEEERALLVLRREKKRKEKWKMKY